jgi:hypothetical protein
MPKPEFRPGFRISATDIVILGVGGIAAAVAWQLVWWAGFASVFVLSQFFLFCNVFRVARAPELIWSASFLFVAVPTVLTGIPGWPLTIATALLSTIGVVVCEMRKPSYHGIGWQWINPGLEAWWHAARRAETPCQD